MAPDLRPLPRQEVGRGARGEQGGREVQGCNQNLQTAIAKRNRSTMNFDCGLLTLAEEALSTSCYSHSIPRPPSFMNTIILLRSILFFTKVKKAFQQSVTECV